MDSCLRSSGLIFLLSSEGGMSFNLQFTMVLLDHRQNFKMAKLQDGSGGKRPRAQNKPSQRGLTRVHVLWTELSGDVPAEARFM